MAKHGVIITSSIYASSTTVYQTEDRFNQTLKTIETIKKHIPDSVICLADNSVKALDETQRSVLTDSVDYFLDFSKDQVFADIAQSIQHKDSVQNLSEIILLIKLMKIINDNNLFDGCERIFKISGRYEITDAFNIKKHDQETLKYVFFKQLLTQFQPNVTQQSLQLMCRLYSFDKNLSTDFVDKLTTMLSHMQERLQAGGYIDIEHMFCKFIPKTQLVELGRMGVKGMISKSGMMIED